MYSKTIRQTNELDVKYRLQLALIYSILTFCYISSTLPLFNFKVVFRVILSYKMKQRRLKPPLLTVS
jgi:hypothetical protein